MIIKQGNNAYKLKAHRKYMNSILVLCAHSDDEAIGLCGTLIKEKEAGSSITKVIFSYGELSAPYLKKGIIKSLRLEETKKANKFIGIKKAIFLGLPDARIREQSKKAEGRLKRIIVSCKPKKIFIPSALDPHTDHRAVNEIALNTIEAMARDKRYKGIINRMAVYAYEVWNIVNELHPTIYEDITRQFRRKLEYIKLFKSQQHFIYLLYPSIYIRAIMYGFKANCTFGEKFYRIR